VEGLFFERIPCEFAFLVGGTVSRLKVVAKKALPQDLNDIKSAVEKE
jgi:hypothetical protein